MEAKGDHKDSLANFSNDLSEPSESDKSNILEYSPKGRFVKFNEIIGTGAYKVVSRGYDNWNGCEVAWNSIKINNLSKKEKLRIVDEVKLLESLNNEFILQFTKAWCTPGKDEVVFITELITGGSLKSYLRKIKHPYLKVIKRWCRSILMGLDYLHS
jgi:WNK lysine deficient protein kinase